MSPASDDAHRRSDSANEPDCDFDYLVPDESRRNTEGKSSKSRRPNYARTAKKPMTYNGIHRRRRKKIRW